MIKALLLLLLAVPASATPWGDVQNRATAANLKPFALDLGGLLGGAAFHTGRSLGFPGFDVDVMFLTQFKPDRDNAILQNAAPKGFGLPLVQASVGLPFKIDVIGHGMTGQGAKVFGGGLRWGIIRSGPIVRIPSLAVSAFADKVTHTHFSAEHYSVNASASWQLPIIHPYAGVGYDVTKVKLGASTVPGLAGSSAWARGTRLTGGVDISPIPFFHVFAAYSLRHGQSGADLGLGFRF
ncbi:MAG: hypothetical protein HY553_00825 [Elusimicrobia bacterium]|nr:hypothetical protein [Elusimicrobiota bacterium]